MAVKVLLTPDAQVEFLDVPRSVQPRMEKAFDRLKQWPNVPGVKWLHGAWKGYARLRVGDYRIIFTLVAPDVLIVRIDNREDVYDE